MNSTSLLIVVPTLNSYRFLPSLLSSIQNQSWPYWKILFVDGPSDFSHRLWLSHCCSLDSRCRWIVQDPSQPGIFGAMNQGFAEAAPNDWILFWGSDDWAASPNVFAEAISAIEGSTLFFDLLVCRGRYVSAASGVPSRPTVFHPSGILNSSSYLRSMFLGSTPPHQATLIGPGARRYLSSYDPNYRLSADLNYFLQLAHNPTLLVRCLDLELVYMSDAGVSGQQTRRRLAEVRSAYRRIFGVLWLFPYIARYIKRLLSVCPRIT